MSTLTFRKSSFFRYITYTVLAAFTGFIPVQPSYAQVAIVMPPPGQMVHVTNHFEPPQMVGLKINLKDPFSFGFIMDQGQNPMSDSAKKEEFNKIIKYFLVSLAMPNKDMWVNLSPYESTRIIPDVFGQTEMGRDLLAQDYVLKQFTGSLMYPEDQLGKKFWNQVYAQAQALFGTTDIDVNTFNKVWIVADHADVYQKGDTAFLVGSHLKVMLEQDFKAIDSNKEQFGQDNPAGDDSGNAKTQMASQLVREIIIPAIEKEVNEGQSFAAVRQIYNAEIMATWFKKTLKESLLGQVFTDKSKIAGQMVSDPQAKDKIFQQYLAAYKQGVFNYIRRDATPDGQMVTRRYLSGGMEQVERVNAIPSEAVEQAEQNEMDMVSRLKEAQTPEAAGRIINESLAPLINNTTTPMDLLEHTYNEPGISPELRDLQTATLMSHLSQPEATPEVRQAQIQGLQEQLGQVQTQSWPAVQALLKQESDKLNFNPNTPLEQPTAEALLQSMGKSPQGMAMLPGIALKLIQTPDVQEVAKFGAEQEANTNNGRLDFAQVTFAPAQAEPQAQQPASGQEADILARVLSNIASKKATREERARVVGETLARILNPPQVAALEAINEQSGKLAQQYTQLADDTNALRDFIAHQLGNSPAMESPAAMAPVIRDIADNQASSGVAGEDMVADMLARLANRGQAVTPAALKDQAMTIAQEYRTQRAVSPAAADRFIQQFLAQSRPSSSSTPFIPRTEMAQVLSDIAANQADKKTSADLMGGMLARFENPTPAANLADLEAQSRELAKQYGAQLDVSDQAAHEWMTGQLNEPQGASLISDIQEKIADHLSGLQKGDALSLYASNIDQLNSGSTSLSDLVEKVKENREKMAEDLEAIRAQQEATVSMAADRLVSAASMPQEEARGAAQDMVTARIKTLNALGGINLSDEHLTLNVKVDGAGMPLPPQYQDKAMMNLNGLVSIIRSITPLTQQNVPALYELAK